MQNQVLICVELNCFSPDSKTSVCVHLQCMVFLYPVVLVVFVEDTLMLLYLLKMRWFPFP
jgi:hypothetical protein